MARRRTAAAPTINLASVAHGLDDYLRDRGTDPRLVLEQARIAPEDLVDPERRVPLVRYLELLELCAETLGDRQFGLQFGARYDPRHAGVVGNIALASSTVRDALATFGRYLPIMVDSAVHRLEVSDGTVSAYAYYLDPLMTSYRQKADWTIGFTCNLIRTGLGNPRWVPAQALFPYHPNEPPDERRRRAEVVGSNVISGHPWGGVRFDAVVLARPMTTADRMLERLMRHYGDLQLSALPVAASEIDQLRREIANLVLRGEITLTRLARNVGMSSRTLQRRLSDAGVSYSELVNDVRRTLALNLMQNPGIALGEIAFSLGYSELSAFNHAFRRWFGCPPGEYRGRAN